MARKLVAFIRSHGGSISKAQVGQWAREDTRGYQTHVGGIKKFCGRYADLLVYHPPADGVKDLDQVAVSLAEPPAGAQGADGHVALPAPTDAETVMAARLVAFIKSCGGCVSPAQIRQFKKQNKGVRGYKVTVRSCGGLDEFCRRHSHLLVYHPPTDGVQPVEVSLAEPPAAAPSSKSPAAAPPAQTQASPHTRNENN